VRVVREAGRAMRRAGTHGPPLGPHRSAPLPTPSRLAALGVPPPELAAIAAVYFVQGLLGLSRLAVTYLLKDEFALSPADTAALIAAGFAPWVIKPVYGFLSDAVPLAGYRRKSYLVLSGVVGAAAWGAMAALVSTPAQALAATLAAAAATACADVVVDSIVVERSRGAAPGAAGSLQSLCWGAAAVGGIVSAYASGALVADAGPRAVFAVTAACPLLLLPAAAALREERVVGDGGDAARSPPSPPPPSIAARAKAQASALVAAASSRSVLFPALFVFAWQATPSPDAALFYFYTDELGLGPEFMGRVRLAGAVASLAGVGAYSGFLKRLPLRTVFATTALAGAALASTQLLLVTGWSRAHGVSDAVFVLADSAVLAALGQAAFMPVLVLAARSCPPGVEATLFAALMSVLNAGTAAGGAAGAALTAALGVTADDGFEGLPTLVAICVGASLLPLALLPLVPNDGEGGEGGEGEEGKKGEKGEADGAAAPPPRRSARLREAAE